MKIGVLYNCQSDGIATALRALLPGAEVINFTGRQVARTAQTKAEAAAVLNACDHVVSCGFGPAFGPLAQRELRRTARRYHGLPPILFTGFHPDTIYIMDHAGAPTTGPTGDYHSRIAIAGYLHGYSAGETAALYNRLIFRRLGYMQTYAEQSALLTAHCATLNIDAAPLIVAWHASGCFMHAINHPKMNVLLDLARAACAKIGAAPENTAVTAADLPDKLARGPMHPVFPDIAAACGVEPEGMFRDSIRLDGKFTELPPEAFVAASFDVYRTLPGERLMASDGVAKALEVVG